MTTSILWLRRDLRLADHPALLAACDDGDDVLPLFVLDDALRNPSGAPRLAFLYRCLRELDRRTGGALRVVAGDPADVVPRVAEQVGATGVHISSDHGPYGRARDTRVAERIPLVATGSPYGVTPGLIRKADGTPYRVYTPYARAWRTRGIHSPAAEPRDVRWTDGGVRSDSIPADPDVSGIELPPAGEVTALEHWSRFVETSAPAYDENRNRPDVDGTSTMSVYLKYGCIHPRTMLADLGDGAGESKLASEVVWRDFYADVLWHAPESARAELNPTMTALEYDGADDETRWKAWANGTTGYPLVDAGMRQLLGEAWVHNRVRMVVASFLLKDLHLHWRRGARHFMQHLRDGDLASNQHGWQWVAGTGTDASPYYRVFNPVKQGLQHDPHGDYVRRWVPELRGIPGAAVHEPWKLPGGVPAGYPERIVDHDVERHEALRRYAAVRS